MHSFSPSSALTHFFNSVCEKVIASISNFAKRSVNLTLFAKTITLIADKATIFLFAGLRYTYHNVRISKCGYREKIKEKLILNQNCAKSSNFHKSRFCLNMSIRLEVNFGPKHQLLYNDYHSDEFYLRFYVSNKPDIHFIVFH